MKNFIEKASYFSPYIVVFLVFAITLASILSLILVDIIIGKISGDYLSGAKWFGALSSLAGTGMLLASGFLLSYLWEKKQYWGAVFVLFVFLAIQSADVYFDGLSVDIMRFGHLVSTSTMNQQEASAHSIYRAFISAISFVGEPLGIASVVAFPMFKKILIKVFDNLDNDKKLHGSQSRHTPYRPNPQKPAPKPVRKPQNPYREPTYRPVGMSGDDKLQKPPWG